MLIKTVIVTLSEYRNLKTMANVNGWILIEDSSYNGEGGSRVGIYTAK